MCAHVCAFVCVCMCARLCVCACVRVLVHIPPLVCNTPASPASSFKKAGPRSWARALGMLSTSFFFCWLNILTSTSKELPFCNHLSSGAFFCPIVEASTCFTFQFRFFARVRDSCSSCQRKVLSHKHCIPVFFYVLTFCFLHQSHTLSSPCFSHSYKYEEFSCWPLDLLLAIISHHSFIY